MIFNASCADFHRQSERERKNDWNRTVRSLGVFSSFFLFGSSSRSYFSLVFLKMFDRNNDFKSARLIGSAMRWL